MVLLTDRLDCGASKAGYFLASILQTWAAERPGKKLAFLAGLPNVVIISAGSDGTDGPTNDAVGYVGGDTFVCHTIYL